MLLCRPIQYILLRGDIFAIIFRSVFHLFLLLLFLFYFSMWQLFATTWYGRYFCLWMFTLHLHITLNFWDYVFGYAYFSAWPMTASDILILFTFSLIYKGCKIIFKCSFPTKCITVCSSSFYSLPSKNQHQRDYILRISINKGLNTKSVI